MKKLNIATLLLVGASLLLASCGKTPEKPHLIVSADTLVFKGNQTLSLYVTTDNTERREFYVKSPYEWVLVSPQSGRIAEGDTVELQLTSYIEDPMTVMEDYLYLTSAFDEKKVKLIGLPEDYAEHSVPESLFFPQDVNEVVMRLNNYGNTTLDYGHYSFNQFCQLLTHFRPDTDDAKCRHHGHHR